MTSVFPEQIQEARVRYRNLSRYCARFVHYALKERRRDAHLLAVVATSNYFDSSYYRVRYEDVGEAGVDPVMHYIDHGAHEGRNPSERFNTAYYVRQYPEVMSMNVNPLLHFLRKGDSAGSTVAPPALGAKMVERPSETADTTLAPKSKEPPRLNSVINYLKSLDDDALVSALHRIESSVVVPRAREHFKGKAWQKLTKLSNAVLNKRPDYQRLLLIFGRAHLYRANESGATLMLSLATQLFPESAEAQHYCGVTYLRAKNVDLAIAHLRSAFRLDPENVNIKRELASALRQASRTAQANSESQAMASEATDLLLEVYRAHPGPAGALAAARALYEQRRYEECLAMLDEVIEAETKLVEHLVLKSKALVGLNRIAEALTAAEQVLKLEPANQAASFLLRTCQFLSGDEESSSQRLGQITFAPDGAIRWKSLKPDTGNVSPNEANGEFQDVVAQLPYDWVQIVPQQTHVSLDPGQELVQHLTNQLDPRAGFHDERGIKLWRRDALQNLARSGLVKKPTIDDLKPFEALHTSVPRTVRPGARAIVMSRNGAYKFGGGEHLLESMAEHYRSLGYEPLIVGTRPEFRGESGEVNGFRFAFVDEAPAALRRFFLEQDAHLVHALSGLGYRVAEALTYTNIPFIYGVHYWREVLGQEDDGFFDAVGQPVPRPEFHYILSRATTVYANSVFTRDVIEKAFGVRCPVIYSVPKDVGVQA